MPDKKAGVNTINIIIAMIIGGGLIFGLVKWSYGRLHTIRRARQLQNWLAGRDPQTLIADSPFNFGHWQGENGYRIWDERQEPPAFIFETTPEACERYILERIMAEEIAAAGPNRGTNDGKQAGS